MRNFFIGIFLLLSPAFLSCKQSLPYGPPVQEPENILKDQRSFMQYWYGNLNLWEEPSNGAQNKDKGRAGAAQDNQEGRY